MEKEAGLRGLKKAPSGAVVQVCLLTLKTWAHTDVSATVQAHIDAGYRQNWTHPSAGIQARAHADVHMLTCTCMHTFTDTWAVLPMFNNCEMSQRISRISFALPVPIDVLFICSHPLERGEG